LKNIVWKKILNVLSGIVWLKNGGYLIFDVAEAMTVIDVNTASIRVLIILKIRFSN
jgi:Ribonuclease G/E